MENKCLLKLCGQTLLERLIVQTAGLGVRDFVFAVGYAWRAVALEVVEVMRGVPCEQLTFVFSDWRKNNGYALWLCRGYFQGDLLLFEGDITLGALPVFDRGKPQWFIAPGYEGGGCFLRAGRGGLVDGQEIVSKGKPGWKKSAGAFYLTADVSQLLQSELESQPANDVYMDAILAQLPFYICDVGIWQEMDDLSDFELAKAKITEPVRYQVDPVLL